MSEFFLDVAGLRVFDAASGKLRWNVQRPGPALALRTSMRLAIEPHLVIAGMPSGRLLVIDTASGAVRWEGTVSNGARGASDLERISESFTFLGNYSVI